MGQLVYVKVGFSAIARAAKTIVNESVFGVHVYSSYGCSMRCYLFKSNYPKKSIEIGLKLINKPNNNMIQ